MLVLTRKAGESICISGGITVTVVSIEGNKVRLGFTAPPDVQIHREEIHRRIMEWAEPAHVVQGRSGEEVLV
jgi:carbon storage regulator